MPMKRNRFLFEGGEGSGEGGSGEGGSGSGEGAGTGGTESQGDGGGTGSSGDERLAKELAEARREAAKYRTERNDLSKRVEELEGATKTEKEKLADDLAKVQAQLAAKDERLRKTQVMVLAGEVGIAKDARADAASLLDWTKIEDPDDDAQVLKALRELVKDRKYLLGKTPGGSDGGEGGGRQDEGGDMNARIRQAAGRA